MTELMIPKQIAPKGSKRDDLGLGSNVGFNFILIPWESDPELDGHPIWRGWRMSNMSQFGVIVGSRTIWSGRYKAEYKSTGWMDEPPEYEPAVREMDVTHFAYLVAYHMRRKPVLVLSDHLTLI